METFERETTKLETEIYGFTLKYVTKVKKCYDDVNLGELGEKFYF